MYGASSNNASLLNINITVADPSQITNENIGLRLCINGVNVTVSYFLGRTPAACVWDCVGY